MGRAPSSTLVHPHRDDGCQGPRVQTTRSRIAPTGGDRRSRRRARLGGLRCGLRDETSARSRSDDGEVGASSVPARSGVGRNRRRGRTTTPGHRAGTRRRSGVSSRWPRTLAELDEVMIQPAERIPKTGPVVLLFTLVGQPMPERLDVGHRQLASRMADLLLGPRQRNAEDRTHERNTEVPSALVLELTRMFVLTRSDGVFRRLRVVRRSRAGVRVLSLSVH